MLNSLYFTLIFPVINFSYFIRIKISPFFTLIFKIKIYNKQRVCKIDESITFISLILEINWQIHKIVLIFHY